MQKWEYAELYFNSNKGVFVDTEMYILVLHSNSGKKVFEIKQDKARGDKSLYDARSRILNQLGIDGWELVNVSFTGGDVNVGYTGSYEHFYFKRALL